MNGKISMKENKKIVEGNRSHVFDHKVGSSHKGLLLSIRLFRSVIIIIILSVCASSEYGIQMLKEALVNYLGFVSSAK